jgi:hypothetical protein
MDSTAPAEIESVDLTFCGVWSEPFRQKSPTSIEPDLRCSAAIERAVTSDVHCKRLRDRWQMTASVFPTEPYLAFPTPLTEPRRRTCRAPYSSREKRLLASVDRAVSGSAGN